MIINDRNHRIITICGSLNHGKELWDKTASDLTLMGCIVLTVNVWHRAFLHTNIGRNAKHILDVTHLEKIEISDAIYVINKDGYIGDSTRNEINYAKSLNKEIIYMEPIKEGR